MQENGNSRRCQAAEGRKGDLPPGPDRVKRAPEFGSGRRGWDEMTRAGFLGLGLALLVAGCTSVGPGPQLGADGRPLPTLYRISAAEERAIPFRMLDSINAIRRARGAPDVVFSSHLNAAAATHSRDMSVQNRPWHFGSDGSSPLVRVQRVGYPNRLLGENISETFQTELETLSAWMADPATREVILDPAAREIGFAWYQEPSGKIWWTLLTGG